MRTFVLRKLPPNTTARQIQQDLAPYTNNTNLQLEAVFRDELDSRRFYARFGSITAKRYVLKKAFCTNGITFVQNYDFEGYIPYPPPYATDEAILKELKTLGEVVSLKFRLAEGSKTRIGGADVKLMLREDLVEPPTFIKIHNQRHKILNSDDRLQCILCKHYGHTRRHCKRPCQKSPPQQEQAVMDGKKKKKKKKRKRRKKRKKPGVDASETKGVEAEVEVETQVETEAEVETTKGVGTAEAPATKKRKIPPDPVVDTVEAAMQVEVDTVETTEEGAESDNSSESVKRMTTEEMHRRLKKLGKFEAWARGEWIGHLPPSPPPRPPTPPPPPEHTGNQWLDHFAAQRYYEKYPYAD